jgi:hypothetical protein
MTIKNYTFSLNQLLFFVVFSSCGNAQNNVNQNGTIASTTVIEKLTPILDSVDYKSRMESMANGDSSGKWLFNGHYPLPGAILPFKRIIAYYGNLYSTRMGILGELPKKEMFQRLQNELDRWNKADSLTPAIPALHYIASTAQLEPGTSGKYRLRMPNSEIDKIIRMAQEINALVFLDIQIGLSTLQEEIPVLEKYLKNPIVHLGIDPEFSMKGGQRPGSVIGNFDAADIQYTQKYLSDLVKKYDLPPKILVIHRFTKGMLKDYKQIIPTPEVQVVIDMDGWGAPQRKINTYWHFAYKEPVQFTGFKIFYKNDLKEAPHKLLTPAELLTLKPIPLYIQYQ